MHKPAPGAEAAPARAAVHIVDDDASMREGICRILAANGHEVLTYDSPSALLSMLPAVGTDVLLLDMRMPEATGLELQEALLARGCDMPIVFLSGQSTISQAIAAMKRGAVDFLVKPFGASDLLRAVEKALAIARENAAQRERQLADEAAMKVLTPREQEVYRLLCRGYRNAEIMSKLGISLHTAKQYKSQVMRKLGVASLSELIRRASPPELPG